MSETITCPRRMDEMGPWERKENLDKWVDQCCSFCGSLDPALVLSRIKAGEAVTPTDKNYKGYLGTDKFYFQHFSKEQKLDFITLYNDKTMKLEHPGYFYRLPFFMQPLEPETNA